VRSPDAAPNKAYSRPGAELFLALGGPGFIDGVPRKNQVNPTFAQVMVPLSQAWCRTSLEKTGNGALLIEASLSDTSATPEGQEKIRKNIAALHFKMLGEPISDAGMSELEALFNEYAAGGTVKGWTAVCSSLVRDPLWVSY
jgi:hypothetical protein